MNYSYEVCTVFLPLNGISTHLTRVVHTTDTKSLGGLICHLYPHFGHGGNTICNLSTLARLIAAGVVSVPPMCCPLI